MRAIVITAPGGPEVLREESRPIPRPGPGEIRVRVRASALNRADLIQRRGGYPAPAGSPQDIPGLEYAGEVDAAGDGAGLWAPGSRVMGIVGGGAHAEYVCVHEREAIRIPQRLSWEEAAAVPEVFLTAYDAMHRQLGLKEGERVLIHAAGSGVGTAALQLARAAGAITIGTSRTPDKLERAQEIALDHPVVADDSWPERVMDLTEGQGVNVILDLVGGGYLAGNLKVLATRGRMIVIGTVSGSRAEIDLGVLLRKRATVVGTVLRSRPLQEKIELARHFSDEILPLFTAGALRPIVDRVYGFDAIAEAHAFLETNDSFGKVVLTW